MSKNFQDIVNTDTFGVWKTRTNEVLGELRTSIVTLDDAIGSPDENTGFIEVTSYLAGTEGRFSDAAEGVKTDKIQPFTPAASIDFSGDMDLTGEITLISTETTPAGASNIIQFNLNDGNVDGLTWSVGPNDDHTKFEIIGTDLTTTDGSASVLYIDDQLNLLSGNITIDSALLSGDYGNLNSAKWISPITLTFNGGISGSVVFDGSSDVTTSITNIAANTASTFASQLTFNFTEDATGSVVFSGNETSIDIPLTVANDSHTHQIDNVTGLRAEIDSKFSLTAGFGEKITGSVYITLANGGIADPIAPGDGASGMILNPNGTIQTSGDITAFADLSDIALKENIERIENSLDKVSQLSGYTFNYISKPDERMTGVIAQEVREVLPEAVYETTDVRGVESIAVRYGNMMGLIIEAIKELRQEVDTIKQQIINIPKYQADDTEVVVASNEN